MNIKQVYKYFSDLVFPNRCPCCKKCIKWNELICENCLKEFPVITVKPCDKCGKTNCICERELSYDYCICPTYYEGIIKAGILNLKLNNGLNFAEYFADKICIKLNELKLAEKIDIVTAVPMSKGKYIERGYNQAYELAKIISVKIKKPLGKNIIKKKDSKLIQHELTYEERIQSVKGAFIFKNGEYNIKGKNILICDDVITSSSTLNECAKLLKSQGASNVFCVCLATTRLNH